MTSPNWKKVGGLDRTAILQSANIPNLTTIGDITCQELTSNFVNAQCTLTVGDLTFSNPDLLSLDKVFVAGNYRQYGKELTIISETSLPN